MKKTRGIQFHKKHPFLAMLLVALMLFCAIQILDTPTIYADPTTDSPEDSDGSGDVEGPGGVAGVAGTNDAGVTDGTGAADKSNGSKPAGNTPNAEVPGGTANSESGTGTESSTGTTESQTPPDEKDVTAKLLKDEYGRIVFWEWTKVTPQNYRETFLKELKDAWDDGKYIGIEHMNYRASLLVYHDTDLNPKGYVSLYADRDHIFRTPYRAQYEDVYDAIEGGDMSKYKDFLFTMNQTSWTSPSGRKVLDNQAATVFYPKLDAEGTELGTSVWELDNFFTAGAPKGALWMRGVNTKNVPFYFGGDTLTPVRQIEVQTALTPGEARGDSGNMFYNSIGKELNGNKNTFIGFSESDHVYWDEIGAEDADHLGGIAITDYSQKMVKSKYISVAARFDDDGTEFWEETNDYLERAPGSMIQCFAFYPYGATEDTDKWVIGAYTTENNVRKKIKSETIVSFTGEAEVPVNAISQYLAVKNGYLIGVDSWYFSKEKTKQGTRIYRYGKDQFSDFPDPSLNMVFSWYVGTPHVFASIKGEGGDPLTGEGGTSTIKKGEVLLLKEAKYLDTDGNEALSEGVVLPEKSSIVIEEGGILSIEGNLINNGKIINKGGTIVIKDGGCVSPFGETQEGTIECCKGDTTGRAGDIVVMPGGRLVALTNKDTYKTSGAVPALDLKDGSTLINYGTFATSYTRVTVGSKIENRKDGVIFAGYNRGKATILYYKAEITKNSMGGLEPIPPVSGNTNVGIKGMIIASRYEAYVEKNMGTLVVEPTSTLNHKNVTVDYTDPKYIEIVTPEY